MENNFKRNKKKDKESLIAINEISKSINDNNLNSVDQNLNNNTQPEEILTIINNPMNSEIEHYKQLTLPSENFNIHVLNNRIENNSINSSDLLDPVELKTYLKKLKDNYKEVLKQIASLNEEINIKDDEINVILEEIEHPKEKKHIILELKTQITSTIRQNERTKKALIEKFKEELDNKKIEADKENTKRIKNYTEEFDLKVKKLQSEILLKKEERQTKKHYNKKIQDLKSKNNLKIIMLKELIHNCTQIENGNSKLNFFSTIGTTESKEDQNLDLDSIKFLIQDIEKNILEYNYKNDFDNIDSVNILNKGTKENKTSEIKANIFKGIKSNKRSSENYNFALSSNRYSQASISEEEPTKKLIMSEDFPEPEKTENSLSSRDKDYSSYDVDFDEINDEIKINKVNCMRLDTEFFEKKNKFIAKSNKNKFI